MQSEASTCRMSGAGAGEPLPGAITLEDLQSMSEAPDEEQEPPQGCDSTHRGGGGSVEDAAGEEQERLLSYWQSVGRGHQVDVPRDMAEPIQQLTRNNHPQRRERIPFTVINRKEKGVILNAESSSIQLGEVLYEKRHYEKAKWACVKVQEDQYEQSICLGFMKIMRYICEQNSSGELQEQPPEPDDPDIIIEEWPPAIIYARGFRGVTNEDSIAREISLLTELLEHPELCLQDTFIVAGYTNPAAANRQNEIWFFERP
ncbi:uncharacterized protein LOC128332910 isoform X3 [Hemicordylus capensis]|uniref:uncharacterized protein LOC128332910 isoform X3 n=1 Tax=Hemicordylus capensis TaxID=884348 RepID=UPI0023037B16|nr:uncharacterized protein LOC128332910 isoform X3 [Hemicordylus capensis]